MKAMLAVLALASLAACGVETATTAAASAEIKRREMEAAKNTMNQIGRASCRERVYSSV